MFQGFGGDRFRTPDEPAPAPRPAVTVLRRTIYDTAAFPCSTSAVCPWARIGELVGHDNLMTTARTYTHIITQEVQLQCSRGLLAS